MASECRSVCLVTELCLTLCDPMDCTPLGSSVHGDSPGKNTGVSYHALLQGVFPTQGSNPGLPHCRWILYHLSHQGRPMHNRIQISPSTDDLLFIYSLTTYLLNDKYLCSRHCSCPCNRDMQHTQDPGTQRVYNLVRRDR